MDLSVIVQGVLKIGLAPVLLIMYAYWYREDMKVRMKHLEDENKRLLDIIEKKLLK